ncbi:AzlD domain-containing protein [Intrasporangium mesophilum]
MSEPAYVATALAVAVAITVTLRAAPFAMKRVLRDSVLLADLGRWMPLGAVTVLALYCLLSIDLTRPGHDLSRVAAVVATVVVHLWRRNAVLSIVAGTVTCLLLANLAHL